MREWGGAHLDEGHAHEGEKLLAVVDMLPRHLDGALAELLDRLLVARLLCLLELILRALPPHAPPRELLLLELRRLAVEDVDGLDARLDHARRAVEHALDVAAQQRTCVKTDLNELRRCQNTSGRVANSVESGGGACKACSCAHLVISPASFESN